MAGRSTRNKIRWQIEASQRAIDTAIEHLGKAHAIAGDRHPRINEVMPQLVVMLVEAKKVLGQFRAEL